MMKRLFAAIIVAALLPSASCLAQNAYPTADGHTASGMYVNGCVNPSGVAVPCGNATTPLVISGSFSATLSGFTPGLTFATLTATGSSASVALPAGVTVFFQNNGTTTVSCTLGIGSATATANQILVPASSAVPAVVGSNTFGACIDQTGSASNLVVLAGGSGLGTPFGGGSAGGGSSAITTWAGGTLGAMVNYGTSPGAVLVPGVNAYITGSAAGSVAGTTSTSALGSLINCASTTSPAGQTTGNQSYVNCTPTGEVRVATGNGYPIGATPLTASATGTTAATTATLAGVASKTTYICSLSVRANATANTNVTNTVTGVITGTLSRAMWVPANTAGLGIDEQIYSPCVPASGTNQAIAVVSGAPGTGGVVTVNATGYQL